MTDSPPVARAGRYTRKRATAIKDRDLQEAEKSSYLSDQTRLRKLYDEHFATGAEAVRQLNAALWLRDRYYAVLDAMIAAQAADLSDGTFDRYLAEESALRAQLDFMGLPMELTRARFFIVA